MSFRTSWNRKTARKCVLTLVLGIVLSMLACTEFFLSATSLQVSPVAAQPGEEVFFVFNLTLVPAQSFTVIGFVNGEEQARETRNESYDGGFVLPIGDAADLIAAFGVGTHVAHVEVQLNESDRSTRTRNVEFLLEE
jgi:hypothetical protein